MKNKLSFHNWLSVASLRHSHRTHVDLTDRYGRVIGSAYRKDGKTVYEGRNSTMDWSTYHLHIIDRVMRLKTPDEYYGVLHSAREYRAQYPDRIRRLP